MNTQSRVTTVSQPCDLHSSVSSRISPSALNGVVNCALTNCSYSIHLHTSCICLSNMPGHRTISPNCRVIAYHMKWPLFLDHCPQGCMTPQCWMMFGNKVLPDVHKKAIAVGIMDILAAFSVQLQMYQSLTL